MKPFEYVQPETVVEALEALKHPGSMLLAGGVDLLDRMKERVVAPTRLVSLRRLSSELGELSYGKDRLLKLGAGVTLAQLAANAHVRTRHPILADAAAHAATPQLREMATLGGNLAQRPRCWYFRNEAFPCRKKGGTTCFAQAGENEIHALWSNQTCAATHASTIATALVALDAQVTIAGAKERRTIELAKLFVAPEQDATREVDLAPGEIIVSVTVPETAARTAYTKQVAKQSFDWPIVDCAVALEVGGGTVKSARIVLGAVAPGPLRATQAELALAGKSLDEATARAAARAMVATATPLSDNAYKLPIVEAVITRTLLAARAS